MKVALAWLDLDDPTDRAVALGLGRELQALGHEPCFIGPKRKSDLPFRGSLRGIPVYRVGPSKDLAVRQLLKIHSGESIELWHCHVFARDHEPFVRAAQVAGWPLVVTFHLILQDYFSFAGGRTGVRRLLQRTSQLSFVAKASRTEFLRLFPSWRGRASVIYNGLDPRGRRRCGHTGIVGPYILSVARLAPYKGLDLLLMAFAAASRRHPELRLVLCGRDQAQGAHERFSKKLGLDGRVIFTGDTSREGVEMLLRRCRFFVLPSRRENFPLAALEAMAAGKAVLTSRVGGIPEMIRDRKEGLLVPPNDIPGLTRAIVALEEDASLRRRLGRAAKLRSRSFSWKRAAASYVRLYERALAAAA